MSRNAGNDENGECDDISPKTKIQANDLETRIPTKWRIRRMRRIWHNYGELDDILAKNLKCKQMSSRQGYQQSGEFDECGEFDKYGKFDDISPKTKIQANKLKRRVPTKRRIRRIRRI